MILLAILDPHPVVHNGLKHFFEKADNIIVAGAFIVLKT